MDRLCQTCRDLSKETAEEALSSPEGWEHLTKSAMARTSSRGCHICTYILDHSHTNLWHDDAPLIFRFFHLPPTAVVNPADTSRGVFTHLEGRVRPSRQDGEDHHIICRISLVCNPTANLDPVKHRIRSCQRHHQACSSATRADLPTRILQIEPNPTPGNDNPQAPLHLKVLVTTTAGAHRKAPYLALSYCWGGSQRLVLTRRNLRSLQRGIDPGELSPTVRDAVWLARELGMDFLWVDALCIVQDNLDDKMREIAKMASIYRGATATIAASTARAASEGFLRGATVAGIPNGSDKEELCVAGRWGHLVATPDVGPTGYTPEHPLDTRGWTLQEFLLSERILVVSDFELLWQCQQDQLCSATSSSGRGGSLHYVPPFDALPYGLWSSSNREERSTRFGTTDEEKVYLWRTIVEQYTRRGLTDRRDRGPALQGIGDALGGLWGERYRFGSWGRFMVPLLGWVQPGGGRRRRISEEDSDEDEEGEEEEEDVNAPTWSWISVEGEIIFPAPVVSEDAVLVDELVDDPRLAAEPDVLVMEGRLFPAGDAMRDDRDGMIRHFDCDERRDDKEIAYLFLGLTAGSVRDNQKGVGIMIAPVMDGVYERVGYMETDDPGLWDEYERTQVVII